MMHGRKLFSTGPVAVMLAAVAMLGGCREATTGPSDGNNSAFAAQMQQVSGNAQTGQIGSALSQLLTVKVVDAGGLPVKGASVTFAAKTGGGSITPPSGLTDATGLVTATWTLGTTLGAQTAVAKLTGSFVTDSTTFSATATPGPGTGFIPVSGSGQTAHAGQQLPAPLIVKVTDSFGNNISGVKVTWTPGNLSGMTTPAQDTTSADGTASVIWTAGNTAATQTVSASIATGTTPIQFTALITADTLRQVTLVAGTAPPAIALEEAVLPSISVRVSDEFGNAVAGDIITWNDSITGGGSLSRTTSTTDATGSASTQWTLGTHAGVQTLRLREGSSSAGNTMTFNVTAQIQFSDVFAGNFQSCGIVAANSRVYCWGAGDAGQLATGTTLSTSNPTVAVSVGGDTLKGPFLQVRSLSGGRDNFCALTVGRQLYCWGRYLGAAPLNVATFEDLKDGSGQEIFPNFSALGQDFGCLLDLAGLGFCTGQNYSGQLGNGALVSPSPSQYSFIFPGPGQAGEVIYSSITTGASHACGMPRYLPVVVPNPPNNSQVPRCWGLNSSGQLGKNKTAVLDTLPGYITLVGVTGAPTGFDSTTLVAGQQHTCAVAVAPAAVAGLPYCWGDNGYGQIGNGSTGGVDSLAQQVVTGGVVFKKLYAGEYHNCGLDASGNAYCWGRDDYGQLGDGTSGPGNLKNSVVSVAGGLVFRSLSLGEFSTCGVVGPPLVPGSPSQSPGKIYCWGDNSRGQLGTGAVANNQPVLLPSAVKFQP